MVVIKVLTSISILLIVLILASVLGGFVSQFLFQGLAESMLGIGFVLVILIMWSMANDIVNPEVEEGKEDEAKK